jgi:hypothetical protein
MPLSMYADFKDKPRWREYIAVGYEPLGLVVNAYRHFAYLDRSKKEFDFSPAVSIILRESDTAEEKKEQADEREKVEDFWLHLPLRRQAMMVRNGLVRFDKMLLIDEKGDNWNQFPHIFVDFMERGPFDDAFQFGEVKGSGYGEDGEYDLNDYTQIKIFPDVLPEPKIGKCIWIVPSNSMHKRSSNTIT